MGNYGCPGVFESAEATGRPFGRMACGRWVCSGRLTMLTVRDEAGRPACRYGFHEIVGVLVFRLSLDFCCCFVVFDFV